jgi:hypothetical protein
MTTLKIERYVAGQNFEVVLIDTETLDRWKYSTTTLPRKKINLIYKMMSDLNYAILNGRNKDNIITKCALEILRKKFEIKNYTHFKLG